MSDIFVSYKAEDRRRIKLLVEALEADGYSVWWDEQIGGGAAWRQAIETELNAAKCVIVAWSKRSVGPAGTFVQDEATRAQQRHVYIPLLIDKVHLPLGFGEMQALPLTGWRGDRSDARYQAVLAAVRRVAGARSGEESSKSHHSGLDRRMVLAGGAVATVALVGAGGWALLRPNATEAAGSIAVLPFANLSGDPAQGYFSDGIAEELRNALSRLAGLKVVGRTSSEAVRNDDAETASKKLEVANILTGSVRQSPSMIRVSAQLIDGTSGLERWSQNYDRPPGDSIKIQTDIAENVARALSITLGTSGREALVVGGTSNPKAQRLLFQALEASRRGDKPALEQGISLIDAAIRLDPNYAEAHAHRSLFVTWYATTFADSVASLFRLRDEATRCARTALRIAPDLATGHRALAENHRVMLELAPAIAEYRRAISLAPGDPGALTDYSFVLAALGKGDEAIRLVDEAMQLDPLSPAPYAMRVMILIAAGRYGDAVSFSQEIERSKPHLYGWPELVAYALIADNKPKEAVAYLNQAPADNYNRQVGEIVIMARTGRSREAEPVLAKMHSVYGDAASYQFGQAYAQLGDSDQAFEALDRAWEIRDSGLIRVTTDPFIKPLRRDARYAALMKKLNFPRP
jgi:serine/threonine-protein kinase